MKLSDLSRSNCKDFAADAKCIGPCHKKFSSSARPGRVPAVAWPKSWTKAKSVTCPDWYGILWHPLASFDLLSILEHLETNCRPLRLEVTEPFVRLFAFPGAGDSVAAWVQFVNKAWTCYVPMFPFLLFLTLFRS